MGPIDRFHSPDDWRQSFSTPELRTHPWLEGQELVVNRDHVSEIILLGVKHNSKRSAKDVKRLLESVDPDMIFLELCPERSSMLHSAKLIDFVKSFQNARRSGAGVMKSLEAAVKKYVYARYKDGSGFAGEMREAAEFVKAKVEGKPCWLLEVGLFQSPKQDSLIK
jgi:hypothetical protein